MADSPVRDNSPDPTRYHSNVGGMPGTMIPRAGREGKSRAFDANVPQVVIVDPGEVGGGFSLDMSQLTKSKANFNSAAVRDEVAQDPTAFFAGLSKAASDEEQSRLKVEPVPTATIKEPTPMATTPTDEILQAIPPIQTLPSITPGLAAEIRGVPLIANPVLNLPSEAEMEARAATFDTEAEIKKLLAEEAIKAESLQASERARASAAMAHNNGERLPLRTPEELQPNNNHEVVELRHHLASQGESINALIGAVNRMTEKSSEPPVTQAETEVDLIEGISSLKIDFLAEGKPQRPQYETYFEMAKMGTMQARYHAVIQGKDCVALVYDTRFEDGFQYLPPSLGEEEITVSVPKLGDAVYTCSSLGLHWTLGCLDIIILIKINKEEQA